MKEIDKRSLKTNALYLAIKYGVEACIRDNAGCDIKDLTEKIMPFFEHFIEKEIDEGKRYEELMKTLVQPRIVQIPDTYVINKACDYLRTRLETHYEGGLSPEPYVKCPWPGTTEDFIQKFKEYLEGK